MNMMGNNQLKITNIKKNEVRKDKPRENKIVND